ncbi:ParA family protein [Pontiella agarivorans]|uniref:AAA family ATPase n=1 Tax=Pontiella agarivorans TaxID=3038953 RepID=A0ABU5N1N9_9BACT|nr:AAA family ATPase [Pontiella agarivorans]MDZ8120366.1 AAA family ATPase [Pontiella agarivorans]
MKIVACYSNKGGVGKTAAAVNLAYAAALSGKRVLLCDLDPQGASGFYFRVKPSKQLREKRFFEDVKRFTKAIRASDFDHLDLLPANPDFRDFDIFLSRMKHSRSRLKKALKAADNEYDLLLLDCPPNISRLSENVFKASDRIIVPVIPTTLSERALEQLYSFFDEEGLRKKKIVPVFSMVQKRKKLHAESMERMRKTYKRFLQHTIPFSSDIEKMGVHRAPALSYAGKRSAAWAYEEVWEEIECLI